MTSWLWKTLRGLCAGSAVVQALVIPWRIHSFEHAWMARATPAHRDLGEDDAAALVSHYDSLHFLNDDVNDWREREGQLPVNLFNAFLHGASKCLRLALICIERFELEAFIPPPYESWGTISFRIDQALKSEAQARSAQLARVEAKARGKA